MKRAPRALSVLAACCALAACTSTAPTRFYALNEIAAPAASAASDTNVMVVRVEPVSIPAVLDRSELVTHTGPNQVHIAGSDRWAAPLDEQIRRILSQDLAARMGAGLVADPNEPSTTDQRRRLSVDIAQFDADENCAVRLQLSWTLLSTHQASQRGVEQIDLPASLPCPATLPAAMSRALASVADRLAPMLLRGAAP